MQLKPPSIHEEESSTGAPFGSARGQFVVIFITWLLIFLLRITGPSELLDNDQQRPAAYLMDLLVNGDWMVQTDPSGEIASKPPLSIWIIRAIFFLGLAGMAYPAYRIFMKYSKDMSERRA